MANPKKIVQPSELPVRKSHLNRFTCAMENPGDNLPRRFLEGFSSLTLTFENGTKPWGKGKHAPLAILHFFRLKA